MRHPAWVPSTVIAGSFRVVGRYGGEPAPRLRSRHPPHPSRLATRKPLRVACTDCYPFDQHSERAIRTDFPTTDRCWI